MLDLSARERAIIYPLVLLVIFFGVYPSPVLDATNASVNALINNVTVSLSRRQYRDRQGCRVSSGANP